MDTALRLFEVQLLLHRYYGADNDLEGLARRLNLEPRTSRGWGGESYIPFEERERILREAETHLDSVVLVDHFNANEPRLQIGVPPFRGRYFYVQEGRLCLGDASTHVAADAQAFLDATTTVKARARRRAFLLALAEGSEGQVTFYGDHMSFAAFLGRMKRILGKVMEPAPKDYTWAKAYGLYFKAGSNRYPAHCMPPEIIPAVRAALQQPAGEGP